MHSFNRYAYANNNPYKYTDPDGKTSILRIARPPVVVGSGTKPTTTGGSQVYKYASGNHSGIRDATRTLRFGNNSFNESADPADDFVKDLDDKSEPTKKEGKKTRKSTVRDLKPGNTVGEAFDNFPGEQGENGVKTSEGGTIAHVHTSYSTGEKTLTIQKAGTKKQKKYRETD